MSQVVPVASVAQTTTTGQVVVQKIPKKLNIVTKFLLATTAINFVCTLAIGFTLTAFQTKTATKDELGEISSEIVAVEMGQKGAAGPIGEKGAPGQVGEEGAAGPMGKNGTAGLIGEKGDTGPRGPSGENGEQGVTGPKGDMGLPGPKGSVGQHGVKGEKGATGPPGAQAGATGGVTYVRWGSGSCPTGASALYTGRTGSSRGGSIYYGGASNYLCIPHNPDYSLSFQSGTQGYNYVYAATYQGSIRTQSRGYSVTCVLCFVSTRNAVIMIPGRASCPSGWTREYYGYLMSEHSSHSRTMYECVDQSMQAGSSVSSRQGYFYHVEAYCNGLSCPPYDNYRELNCVVCTK